MELLQTLRLYQVEFMKVEELEREIIRIQNKGKLWIRIVVSLIVGGWISFPLCALFQNNDNMMAIMSVLCPIIVFVLWSGRLSQKKKTAIKPLKDKIEGLMKKINSLEYTIPENYHTADAIKTFIHYIESFQATTLQECAKLYNEELRHRETMSAMSNLRYQLSSIESEVAAARIEAEETNYRLKQH